MGFRDSVENSSKRKERGLVDRRDYENIINSTVWSYSRLSTFHNCPYQFYIKYFCHEKDKPMFFAEYGTYAHEIIENYYRGNLSKEEMPIKFLTGFTENVKGDRPKKDLVQKYINLGTEYFKNFEPFPFNMIDVEKKVEFEVAGLKFIGFIDYLGEKDGEYYIVDNKSRDLKKRSKRETPTQNDKLIDKMLRQLYIYSAAVKDEYGKFPKALCFNCFKAGNFIVEPFRMDKYEEAINWAVETVEEIKQTDDFYPHTDYFSCNNICGVSDHCIYHEMEQKEMRRKRWKKS